MSLVHLHLLLNHVPVVGVLFVVILLAIGLWRRNGETARVGLALLIALAAVTAVVFLTGEPAEEAVENVAGIPESIVHAHEDAAGAALAATGIGGVLALGLLFWYRGRDVPRWTVGLALIGVMAIGGLMAWTANLGGQIRHSEIRTSISAGEIDRDDR